MYSNDAVEVQRLFIGTVLHKNTRAEKLTCKDYLLLNPIEISGAIYDQLGVKNNIPVTKLHLI